MHNLNRRVLIGAALTTLAAFHTIADAFGQDVLDPSILKKPQPKPKTDELLDPSTSNVARVESIDTPQRVAGHDDPGYARGMNVSVSSALVTLLHACANSSNAAETKAADCADLSKQLANAMRDKWAKLDEYRQGMFCSGCGKTKSEILGAGEQFPHPGQTAIPATPQQIAAKELTLDRDIDAINKRLELATTTYKTRDEEASEALDQLACGMPLWRLAVAFEQMLIKQSAMDLYTPAKEEFDKAGNQIRTIQSQAGGAMTPEAYAAVERDLFLWDNIRLSSADRATKVVAASRARLEAAAVSSRSTRDALQRSGREVAASMTDRLRGLCQTKCTGR